MYRIDLFHNRQVMKRFLLLQVIVVLAFIVLSYKWAMIVTTIQEQRFFTNIIIGILGFLVIVCFHEGMKTLLFKMISNEQSRSYQLKNGVLLTFLPKYFFNRITFLTVMLLPSVLICLLLFVIFINLPYTSVIFVFAIYMGYCLISFYLVFIALKDKKAQYFEMTEDGLILYQRKPTHYTNKMND